MEAKETVNQPIIKIGSLVFKIECSDPNRTYQLLLRNGDETLQSNIVAGNGDTIKLIVQLPQFQKTYQFIFVRTEGTDTQSDTLGSIQTVDPVGLLDANYDQTQPDSLLSCLQEIWTEKKLTVDQISHRLDEIRKAWQRKQSKLKQKAISQRQIELMALQSDDE